MLEWIISSSALILLVLAVRALGKNRLSCRARYALWLLVLVRLLVPVQLFTASWGARAIELPERVTEPSIYVLPMERTPVPEKEEWDELRQTDPSVQTAPFDSNSFGYSRLSPDGREVVRYADKWSVADIARAVWLTGAGLLAAVLLVSNLRFLLRIRRGRVPCDALCGGMRVYVAEGLASPCLVGVLRPSVYLTPESTRDSRVLRHVLAHETTHRLHGDCAWSVLRLIALCLHWYNPLVWYAVIVSKRDGELACDEATLARLGEDERAAYGETLLSLVLAKPGTRELLSVSTAMTAGKRTLRERIESIAKHRRTKGATLLLACAVLLTATVFAFSGTVAREDSESGIPGPEGERASIENPAAIAAEGLTFARYGNSGGNVNNGGYAAYDGAAYYYVLPAEESWEIKRGSLVRANADGSVSGVLYSGNIPNYLNVAGRWLFFSALTDDGAGQQIYKLRTDGFSLRALLSDDVFSLIRNVVVMDDNIYFSAQKAGGSDYAIYKVPTDGGKAEPLAEIQFSPQSFVVEDGWIYCSDGTETTRIGTDGSGKTIVSEIPSPHINVESGKLFSLRGGDICRMGTDGSGPVMLTKNRMIVNMNVSDGWIYFYADSSVFKMKADGGEARQVCDYPREAGSFPGIIVLGDWLYLTGGEQGCCRVRTDGSGFQAVAQPREADFDPRFTILPGVPSESEVLALRERVEAGMSDGEITRLIRQVMAEHYWWESGYLYDNIFGKLSDPDSMTWNYLDRPGEIQIGWAYDGSIDKDAVCAQEGWSEDEFYAHYGERVSLPNNTHDAESFRKRMLALKSSVKSGLLDEDFDRMIALCDQARETHDVDDAVELYHMLHDLDYFLLRYGVSDVGRFVTGPSTASTYYGCLSVWNR